jgi:hypothetical protein
VNAAYPESSSLQAACGAYRNFVGEGGIFAASDQLSASGATQIVATGGGAYVAGDVQAGGGPFVGRDNYLFKTENNYYLTSITSQHEPVALTSVLDETNADPPLLSAARSEELALLHAWHDAVLSEQARQFFENALRIFEEIESPHAETVRKQLAALDQA